MSDISGILENLANGAAEVAKYAPPPANIVAGIAAAAFKAGAAIAHAGRDPVGEIERILDRNPEVVKVRDEWDEYIKANWSATTEPAPPPIGRRKTDPPPASVDTPHPPDTLPGADVAPTDDPYEE